MMSIQNLVLFCQLVLKKNQILTSIKGRNSVANLRKTMIYITNVDLVNDSMCIQNLVLVGLFVFKTLSHEKLNSDVNLLQVCRNSNSSKLSCMSSLPARMKKIKIKMKVLDCSQDFFHYQSMGIFPDAQGQLTLQSTVRSGKISNSSKT